MSDNPEELQIEEFFDKHPDSMIFARVADSYLQENRVDEAIHLCEAGIKKHPYYATGHFVLGKCYMHKKLYEHAEKEFKRVLLFDPKYLAAHKLYGDLMDEIGWENTCEMSYKKILQIDPLDRVAQKKTAEFARRSNQDESEINELDPNQVSTPVAARPPISPMPVTEAEEDLMFEEQVETTSEPQHPVEQSTEEELDDKKAEEFSYILDDIFKDEGVEMQQEPDPEVEEKAVDEAASESPQTTDSYRSDFTVQGDEEPPVQQLAPEENLTHVPLEAKREATPAANPISTLSLQEEPEKPQPDKEKPASPIVKQGGDKIVTPTLGEIYAAQGQYSKAIDVFETLLKKSPDNEFYKQKLSLLQAKLEEAKNEQKS